MTSALSQVELPVAVEGAMSKFKIGIAVLVLATRACRPRAMLLRKVAAVTAAGATVEVATVVVTEAEGIFTGWWPFRRPWWGTFRRPIVRAAEFPRQSFFRRP